MSNFLVQLLTAYDDFIEFSCAWLIQINADPTNLDEYSGF